MGPEPKGSVKSHLGYPLQPTKSPRLLFCKSTSFLHFGHASSFSFFTHSESMSRFEKSAHVRTRVGDSGIGTPRLAPPLDSTCFENFFQNPPMTFIQSSFPVEISSSSVSKFAVKP